MTPLPSPLGSGGLTIWRVDDARYAREWNRGTGAAMFGGRWNAIGNATVYTSLDPATAILEVAVHRGFRFLDTVPHVLTWATIVDPRRVHVVAPDDLPDPGWLAPHAPQDAAPQLYGDHLLARFPAVCLPSSVSRHSWNLVIRAGGDIALADIEQERLVVDPRLHAP